MYGDTYSKSMEQPGKVANPDRGQLNREENKSCSRSCLGIRSRETGSAVPSGVSLLISKLRLNLVRTYGILPEFRGGVQLCFKTAIRHRLSPEFIGSCNLLRTVGVHCRESAGTGPVNLKVVPNECCLGRSPWTNKYAPLFPPSHIHYWYKVGMLKVPGATTHACPPVYVVMQWTRAAPQSHCMYSTANIHLQ